MLNHLNLLHLQKRTDRIPSLLRQLAEQQIDFYSIWEGIDNKKNTKQAITTGYKRIIQRAKNNSDKYCLLAEDDVVFSCANSWQYFLSQIPLDFDLFMGNIYQGQVDGNRIIGGMSGTMTLFCVHQNFYDFILNMPDDSHIDRYLGGHAKDFKYFLCEPLICFQSGSYSDQKRRALNYEPYMLNKNYYGREGQTLINGIWQKKPSA